MEKFIFWLAATVAAVSVGYSLYGRYKLKRIMEKLSDMLDIAISGGFKDSVFDESLYSALEAKLARFLAQSSLSAVSVERERDKIKELIADISHQTKTPIANIVLYAQLLGEADLPDDCRQQVKFIINQSEKLNFLINALIKLSRLETGIISVNPKPDSVSKLLASVSENISSEAEAKNIELIFPDTDAEAVFDLKWTSEAVCNIADNAVKYTPSGGRIEFSVIPYDMFCRIDIADTGIGIPEDELGKIFRRFYRSHSVSDEEGVGIGLFLSREIISAEGGYIRVSSKVGKGSVFSLFLPRQSM